MQFILLEKYYIKKIIKLNRHLMLIKITIKESFHNFLLKILE